MPTGIYERTAQNSSRPMNIGKHRMLPVTIRSMSNEEAAWVGAMFEGEGSVRILKKKKRNAIYAEIYNTDPEVISTLLRLTGIGNISARTPIGISKKFCFTWAIQQRNNARAFFERIVAYSTKAQRALERMSA